MIDVHGNFKPPIIIGGKRAYCDGVTIDITLNDLNRLLQLPEGYHVNLRLHEETVKVDVWNPDTAEPKLYICMEGTVLCRCSLEEWDGIRARVVSEVDADSRP